MDRERGRRRFRNAPACRLCGCGRRCLYAPGMTDLSAIRNLVSAVAPKPPVNVLLIGPNMRVAGLAAAGVHRASVGGALAVAAWSGFESVYNPKFRHSNLRTGAHTCTNHTV